MATPLWSNPILLARATTLQTLLNSGKTVRLFKNSFLPTPATPLSAFAECDFAGYAAIPLDDVFGAPTFVQDGQYSLDSGILVFSCTASPSQTIWGWYIDDGTNMISCQQLDQPVTICANGVYQLELRPQEISSSVLPAA